MQYEIIHRVRGVEWYVRDRRGRVPPGHPREFACVEEHERIRAVAPNITAAREVRDAYIDHDTGGRPDCLEGKVIIRRARETSSGASRPEPTR